MWGRILFTCAIALFFAPAAHADIVIDTDTVWTRAESPHYVSDDLTVAAGATLTIEPGVVVKFSGRRDFIVNGSLIAEGTEAEPIYFTSYKDDTVGGDTNGDGDSSSPSVEDWNNITISTGGYGSFAHAVVRYNGYWHSKHKTHPALYNNGGTLSVDSSTFSNNRIYDIAQSGGSLTVTNSSFEGSTYGVLVLGGDVSVRDSLFSNVDGYGVLINSADVVTISGNVFDDMGYPIGLELEGIASLSLSGNEVTNSRWNAVVLRGTVTTDIALSDAGIPYLITTHSGLDARGFLVVTTNSNLEVAESGTLTIQPGLVFKMENAATLDVYGTLTVGEENGDGVVFTSVHDDTVGGDTESDGDAENPVSADWRHIGFYEGSVGTFWNTSIKYGGYWRSGTVSRAGLYNNGGEVSIEGGEFEHNFRYGIRHVSGTTTVAQSVLHAHTGESISNVSGVDLDARNNYWGDPSGPYHGVLNSTGTGGSVSDNVLIDPWLSVYCETECYSNVLFLPGIMGSRLYEGDDKLWEPNIIGADSEIQRLYLDENGDSVVADIYTRDVIDSDRAYEAFVNDLASYKADGTINDYAAVPYDWRLSLQDIITSGKQESGGSIFYNRATSTPYIEQTLRQLAADSKTGKVTIIAHSNGGLVTKALINSLGADAASLVDEIVFVGVPQLGTPKAVGAIAHGYDVGIPELLPIIVSPARARDFSLTSPMMYQLLPFSDYYNSEGETTRTPIISFEDGAATQPFIDEYGYAASNASELHDFIIGTEGRSVASYNDLSSPAVGNESLLSAAEITQSAIDGSWEAPSEIHIHQIAGVGEYTVAGLVYKSVKKCAGSLAAICFSRRDTLSYTPVSVLDGDGTVVTPSALAMSSENENVNRWWVDLQDYNKNEGRSHKEHGNILEINQLRTFLFDYLLTQTTNSLPQYISSSAPDIEGEDFLSFVLHSPLALSAIDDEGNVVSEDENEIPGAMYERFGDVQVITIPTGTSFTLHLTGEEEGSFTLEISESENSTVSATTTFSAIPSATSTSITMTFTDGTIEGGGTLEVDYDGDGVVDARYTPKLGLVVTDPDSEETVTEEQSTETSAGGGSASSFNGRSGIVAGISTDIDLLTLLALLNTQLISILEILPEFKESVDPATYDSIVSKLYTAISGLTVWLQLTYSSGGEGI